MMQDIAKISQELKRQAIALGLCQQWQEEWLEPSADELCEMYIRGLDFCIKHDYPSVKFMKENMAGVMQRHGIFADQDISGYNPRTVIANGACNGCIIFDGFSVGQVYVRHNSNLSIIVLGDAVVNIRCYENAHIRVYSRSDRTKTSVILHGGDASVVGPVKVIDRRNK